MLQQLKPTTFKDDYWMTSDEAQHFLKVSRSTLYRWCKTKQLPFTKMGGVLYFPKVYIQQLLGYKLQNILLQENHYINQSEAV
ncbi:MAG: helix-turn-helix domain-containing protein [Flavobacteriaceae bacterium]|nr:helix-turn-helix domain-containing protein [Flavobacteriaceae bacterium]